MVSCPAPPFLLPPEVLWRVVFRIADDNLAEWVPVGVAEEAWYLSSSSMRLNRTSGTPTGGGR